MNGQMKLTSPLPLKHQFEKAGKIPAFRIDVYEDCVLLNWRSAGVDGMQYFALPSILAAYDFIRLNFGTDF